MNFTNAHVTSIQRVETAIKALQDGKGILLIDDENRENEGDLIFSAVNMTIPEMALMIRECSGIVCLCLPPEKAKAIGLKPMVENNTSHYGTNFTFSIEAANGVTTGVSATDRITTIKTAIADNAIPNDLVSPGHVFPLIAKSGGVFERDGHTEGSVDLMKLAGLPPYSVLCELTNVDGTMAKIPEITRFSQKHNFPIVSILDIIRYKNMEEKIMQETVSSNNHSKTSF